MDKPPKKKPTPVKETKALLFLRLATPRIEKVLKALRILGNCSNKSSYEYSDKQVDEMSETLVKALEKTIVKFHDTKKEQESFEFSNS